MRKKSTRISKDVKSGKKYGFVEGSDKKYGIRTIRRIVALKSFGDVRKGDLGGWVECERNLSQTGRCWIGGEARAIGDSCVKDNAVIRDSVSVIGQAVVAGDAVVDGEVRIMGKSRVDGHAKVHGRVRMKWMSVVTGNAEVGGDVILTYKDLLDDGTYDIKRIESLRKSVRKIFVEGQKKTGLCGAHTRWGVKERGKTKTIPISKDVYDRLISIVGLSMATSFSGKAILSWLKEGHSMSEAAGFNVVKKDNGRSARVRIMPNEYEKIRKIFGTKKENDGAKLVEVVSRAVSDALSKAFVESSSKRRRNQKK